MVKVRVGEISWLVVGAVVSKLFILSKKWEHRCPIFTIRSTIIDFSKKKSFKVNMASSRIGESREVALRKDHPIIAWVQIDPLWVKVIILEAHQTHRLTRQISLWQPNAREYNQLLIRHPATSTMPLTNNQTFSTRALIVMEVKRIRTEQSRWTAGPNRQFSGHHYQMSLIAIARWTSFQIFVARIPCWLSGLTRLSIMVEFPKCLQSKWYSS